MLQRPDGALLEGGKGDVGDDACGFDLLPGLDDLLVTLGGEGNVNPSSEFVLEVPRRFAVADEDQGVLVGRLEGGEAVVVVGEGCLRASDLFYCVTHPEIRMDPAFI